MPMGFDNARHLLQRAGFGGDAAAIEAMAALEVDEAVGGLLAGVRTDAVTPAPDWLGQPLPSREERRRRREELFARRQDLRGWWFRELVDTPSSLTERLVLLWHNHFTTNLREVPAPNLVYQQNALFRRHALGSFRTLLHEVARDPAMLLYLDTASSTRRHPNENFARELLELFTLGEGHYTETDIREAARAFSGWVVDRRSGRSRFVRRRHDPGVKTFLGRTGRFDGSDVLDILLERPQVARFVAEEAWRTFVSPTPEPSELTALADAFFASDYRLDVLVRGLLTTPSFWSENVRGRLVKSPVELIVGTARLFGVVPDDTTLLARVSRRMGQDLFNPPNVAGWPGGTAWITSGTLLERQRALRQVARSDDLAEQLGPGGLSAWVGADSAGADVVARAARILLPVPPVVTIRATNEPEALEQILLDPAYQLC